MNFENYELLKIIILPAKITTPMDDQTRERKKHFRTAMKDPRVYTPIKALPMPHRTTRELKHRYARLQQDIPPSPPFKPATPHNLRMQIRPPLRHIPNLLPLPIHHIIHAVHVLPVRAPPPRQVPALLVLACEALPCAEEDVFELEGFDEGVGFFF